MLMALDTRDYATSSAHNYTRADVTTPMEIKRWKHGLHIVCNNLHCFSIYPNRPSNPILRFCPGVDSRVQSKDDERFEVIFIVNTPSVKLCYLEIVTFCDQTFLIVNKSQTFIMKI